MEPTQITTFQTAAVALQVATLIVLAVAGFGCGRLCDRLCYTYRAGED